MSALGVRRSESNSALMFNNYNTRNQLLKRLMDQTHTRTRTHTQLIDLNSTKHVGIEALSRTSAALVVDWETLQLLLLLLSPFWDFMSNEFTSVLQRSFEGNLGYETVINWRKCRRGRLREGGFNENASQRC